MLENSPMTPSPVSASPAPPSAVSQNTAGDVAPVFSGRRARFQTGLREAAEIVRRERAWLWLLLPYLFAWIVPAQWSRDQWGVPNHSFSFQPLVPFLAGFIAWSQRDAVRQQKARLTRKWKTRDWRLQPSSLVLVLGLALFLFSHVVQVKGIIVLSLWLVAVGALWRVYNGLTVGLLWKPLLFALLVIPPPDSIIDNFAHRMQAQSAAAAASLLRVTHLAGDSWSVGWTLNLKGSAITLPSPCSGLNTLLPLMVLFGCYLLCVKAPPLRIVLLLLLGGVFALGANIGRIMLVGLVHLSNSAQADTLANANTYLLIGPLLLLLIVVDQKTKHHVETKALTGGTLRVAAGAGVAVGIIFRPLDWLMEGVGGLGKLSKRSERGLEKLITRLLPKKKKRNRW